jgi:hypothetical protein
MKGWSFEQRCEGLELSVGFVRFGVWGASELAVVVVPSSLRIQYLYCTVRSKGLVLYQEHVLYCTPYVKFVKNAFSKANY